MLLTEYVLVFKSGPTSGMSYWAINC